MLSWHAYTQRKIGEIGDRVVSRIASNMQDIGRTFNDNAHEQPEEKQNRIYWYKPRRKRSLRSQDSRCYGRVGACELVPAEFHQAQKGTRHRACIILYANTILYLRTLAIEGSEGLLYLEMKEEDRSLTDDSDDPEAL